MLTVRFAPSPTGWLHLGSARTALFNWLAARNGGGRFLLRVEDTDKVRSEQRFLDEILEDLGWLGLDWDGELTYQSRRFDLYRARAEELAAQGKAYREGEAFLYRVEPGRIVAYTDLIHGRIEVATENIKDQVLIKSDGSPSYNFACVVDDSSLGVTHILRGDDHISNTPKQILFYEALGIVPPEFGHMPLILGPDGKRLSKRHGATSVDAYREMGFLPEALVNYLARLGWAHGDLELFDTAELLAVFSIDGIGTSAGRWDLDKLTWVNQHWIGRLPADRVARDTAPFLAAAGLPGPHDDDRARMAVEIVRSRARTLVQVAEMAAFCFLPDESLPYDAAAVRKFLGPSAVPGLEAVIGLLDPLPAWTRPSLEAAVTGWLAASGLGLGAVAQPIRVAITGSRVGPGLFETLEALGRDRALARLRRGLALARAATSPA